MDEDKRIVIENLTTRYPGTEQPQLRQINAEVHTGQVVGIIGNSHSGKSTLCRVLAVTIAMWWLVFYAALILVKL